MAEQKVASYLAAVTAELGLPEPWARDVRDELAAHLSDGIEDEVGHGLSPEDAAMTVIDRLGAADSLARDLRRAHQTPQRLAAGLVGGAVAAVGGAIRGTIVGFAGLLVLALLAVYATAILQRAIEVQPELAGVASIAWSDTLAAAAVAIGALVAGRAAASTSAARSRRSVRTVGRWWAAAGMALLGSWVVFGVEVALSWPAVIALLAIPLAFAGGALVAVGRTGPRLGARYMLTALAACVIVPALAFLTLGSAVSQELGAVGAGPYSSIDALWHARGLDAVGRPLPPAMSDVIGTTSGVFGSGVASLSFEVTSPAALRDWSDLRLEAWRMTRTGFDVAAGQAAPFASVPATLAGGTLAGSLRVDRTRGVEMYGVLLTGVGQDGIRYVLAGPNGGQTAYRGTVWDWFTSP